jgi:hypothetical protein
MKKTERGDYRFHSGTKEVLNKNAQKAGKNASAYLEDLILNDKKSPSHEQLIEHSLKENQLINSLLTSDELSLKSKQFIGKEIKNYV